MSESFELRHVDSITSGTVGPPGARVFYLQAAQGDHMVTLRMEKQQLAALCEHLGAMMADLPELPFVPPGSADLRHPVAEQWTIGGMGIAYEHDNDSVVLVVEELVMVDDADPDVFDPDPFDDDEPEPATARLHVARQLVPGFINHSRRLITAGRPTCDLCANPVDPTGHMCPRLN